MKLTNSVWQTYKEIPAEAEITSHQLMMRAGLIHKLGSGLYAYMPFAKKVLRKIENIIRKEMDSIGGQEISMNVVTPAELWQESGRWEKMGNLMLTFKDKNERDLCISPTNEEAVTDIFRKTVKSYKQLPTSLYQINTKFRDEIRPRFGLMRAREFTMKDAYSFHMDKECLDKVYADFYRAYENSFNKMGLRFSVVEADAGDMGSVDSQTHEFQVIAESGEDVIIFTEDGNYAANAEKAETKRANLKFDTDNGDLELVETKEMGTIEQVCNFLGIPEHHAIKSLIYTAITDDESETFLIQLLGDDELNELKLKNYLGCDELRAASVDELKQFNLPKGFIGAVNIDKKIQILFDKAVNLDAFYSTGALKVDYHYKKFQPKRDALNFEVVDLRLACAGDLTLDGVIVKEKKGIEVGHIFQLGDKYTKAMKANILDQNGKTKAPLMGCYGIGVTRVMAAAIEQSHDEKGIIWPKEISPFDVHLVLIGKSEEIKEKAVEIYTLMKSVSFDVLFDDRKAGPGFKFKDADLLGVPVQVVLGEKGFKEHGKLELINRATSEKELVSIEELTEKINILRTKIK